jgi:hypothetical protein
MNYDFKRWPELGWAVLVGIVVAVTPIVVETDVGMVGNWQVWAVALAAAAARAGIAAAVAWFARPT